MSTNKNRINAYVDNEAYKAFQTFCNEKGCSQSKGVELLIKQLLGQSNVDKNVSLEDLEYKLDKHCSNLEETFKQILEDEIVKYHREVNQKLTQLEEQIAQNK